MSVLDQRVFTVVLCTHVCLKHKVATYSKLTLTVSFLGHQAPTLSQHCCTSMQALGRPTASNTAVEYRQRAQPWFLKQQHCGVYGGGNAVFVSSAAPRRRSHVRWFCCRARIKQMRRAVRDCDQQHKVIEQTPPSPFFTFV